MKYLFAILLLISSMSFADETTGKTMLTQIDRLITADVLRTRPDISVAPDVTVGPKFFAIPFSQKMIVAKTITLHLQESGVNDPVVQLNHWQTGSRIGSILNDKLSLD